MNELPILQFDSADAFGQLQMADPRRLDELSFGVIGFDAQTDVRCYNAWESEMAGLSPHRVLGNPLFTTVAPCMNNFMVAQRFDEALADGVALDATIDYVFTLRMRPTKVQLRLLFVPGATMRYVLVRRPGR